MADLDTLLAGAETRLQAITGLRTSPCWPDQINPPHAWVVPGPTAEHIVTLGGVDARETLDVYLVVAEGAGLKRAQQALNDYVSSTGTKSVWAAFRADDTLDGAASAILSFRRIAYGDLELAEGYWVVGAIWRMEVYIE